MKRTLSPINRFWLLLKPDGKEIRNIYVYAFFNGLVSLSLPVGIQAIINLIQGGQMTTSWVVLVSFVILGIIFSGILQINQLKITENLQQKIFTRAAFEFAYRVPRVKLEAIYRHYAPELMNRFFDVVAVQKGLSKVLIDFSTASIQTIFGLILLCLYHPFFIVYSMVLVVLVYAIFKLTSAKGLSTSLTESKHKYTVVHWLEEMARSSIGFKLAGNAELPMRRVNNYTEEYIDSRDQHFRILKLQYILMVAFKVLVAAGLLIVGSVLVMEQQMNIGEFVAAEIIILLVMGSVEKIIQSLETIYDLLASIEKIAQVTDLELESNIGMSVEEEECEGGMSVEVKDVSFSYPYEKELVIKNLNLRIEGGSNVLLTGASNEGKSTLLYLISNLYLPIQGSLILNELPARNYNPQKLRESMGALFLNETLFEGTVLENITMGRDRATMENVKWALKNVGLTRYIKSLPDGLSTQISPQGKQFSKGVVDKLLLARTIVDRPKLLLLKDVFSSMGEAEKLEIVKFLTNKENGWTLIMVSNSIEIRSMMDRVLEVKDKSIKDLK
ncbi:peptidase domain-containing ABC transporter [Lishizhenia sp.]|uniref:peptidase domain-containing ABC transporter n=1 Tax=Lishizhenia sp. TaxID=2497594 RepID=UPI00299EDFC0|nr:ATP-binding cassette domain-containing protein [Lishizhenia sp.]